MRYYININIDDIYFNVSQLIFINIISKILYIKVKRMNQYILIHKERTTYDVSI